uniref:MHC class I-like antigen recognition-like domain-containing protein n=1 Tax=Periophthalmus magnuspinnatus TaxID=409849 RepID=A0A3B4BFE2_9GOBI
MHIQRDYNCTELFLLVFIMKTFVALILLGILIKDMIHSLRYFDTSSSQVPNFPEHVVVGVVNGLEIMRCDSETRRYEPKQEWMNRVTEDDPKFWDWNTQLCVNNLQVNKGSIENIKQRFNQTEGAHIWQRMFGCDWDDETDDITGYYQYAFDGQDFISLDLSTESWVAAKSEAFATKLRWERIGQTQRHKHYVHKVCAVWLKNYVRYGEKTLKRTGEKRHTSHRLKFVKRVKGSIMLIVCSLSSLIQNLPEELLDTNHACLSNLVISPGQSWTRVFPVGQGTFCAGHCQSCATPHSPDVTLQWPALIQLFLGSIHSIMSLPRPHMWAPCRCSPGSVLYLLGRPKARQPLSQAAASSACCW